MPRGLLFMLMTIAILGAGPSAADTVRMKDLGRFLGWRDNALVGYGLVTGLAGSGDSSRSTMTQLALKNVLSRLGANVPPELVQSRNVAVVVVTATLPPSAHVGDRIDVTISSVGDARSLVGGTLLMTPLMGPDQRPYALAQGSLVVGGYRFDSAFNREQKNYPTSATVPAGATVEAPVRADLLGPQNALTFILNQPDTVTAERAAAGINQAIGAGAARVLDASSISIDPRRWGGDVYGLISRVESVAVTPDDLARVVINERTGTVVAGGRVQISSVMISQGDVRISVSRDNEAPQPYPYDPYEGGYGPYGPGSSPYRSEYGPAFRPPYGGGYGRLVIANTKLTVTEPGDAVVMFPNTTVADLMAGLSRVHVDTRGMIAILQAIRAAGALHAEIIVQ
jgi:flagellar P-ring protein FlgI